MVGLQLLALCIIPLQLFAQASDRIPAFCDDKEVEESVDLALVKFNKKLQYGNQFALYRILTAFKAQNESGTLFTVHFQAKESNCAVGADKVWKDCEYLLNDKEPNQCNATVHKSNPEANQEVVFVECLAAEPRIVTERAPCLGCPEDIDIDNEDIKVPVMYSVAKFNAHNESKFHFVLLSVGYATRQVVAGFRYELRFDMAKSNCSKALFKDLTDDCHPTQEDTEYAYCNSSVLVAPWRHEEPEAHIDCGPGRLSTSFARRRPPGWSPLRNLQTINVRPTPAPVSTSASKPAKEESSEESKESSSPLPSSPKKAQSGDAATAVVLPTSEPQRRLNCPSNPWKSSPPKTTAAPQQSPSPVQEAGEFSDLDLL
ncbi:kininogen precursor-like [Arapaima gigas]